MTVCRNRVSLQVFLISSNSLGEKPGFFTGFSHFSQGITRNPVSLTRNRVSLQVFVISDKGWARNPVSSASLGQKPGFWNIIKPIWETVDSIVLLAHRHKLLLISEILARLDRLIVTQWEDLFHHNHRGYSYPVNRLN